MDRDRDRSRVLININPFEALDEHSASFGVLEKTHRVAIKRLSQWNYDPTSLYLRRRGCVAAIGMGKCTGGNPLLRPPPR